jgi:hypothetical protein
VKVGELVIAWLVLKKFKRVSHERGPKIHTASLQLLLSCGSHAARSYLWHAIPKKECAVKPTWHGVDDCVEALKTGSSPFCFICLPK